MTPHADRTALLRVWSTLLAAAATSTAVALAIFGPLPPLVPLLLLGGVAVGAEHLVLFRPQTANLGTEFMLTMTGVVLFHEDAALLGPMVVAMCSAVFVPHVRARAWSKIAFNVGSFGLSALAAASVYALVDQSRSSTPWELLAAVPAAVALVIVNLVAMTVLVTLRDAAVPRRAAGHLLAENVEMIPLALFGALLGELALDLNALVIPLFVGPLLVARQMYSSASELEAAHESVLVTLAAALEAKDTYTAGHAARVAHFAGYIADELGLGVRTRRKLRVAALVHDFGKLAVPKSLLNKPGPLTAEEYSIVRGHEELSRELLAGIDFVAPTASEAVDHPDAHDTGSKPTVAHIITVADAFDAMTSTRPYRRALDQDVAFTELRNNVDTQFHRRCVEALISAVTRRRERYGAGCEADPAAWPVPPPARGPGSAGLGDLAQRWKAVT